MSSILRNTIALALIFLCESPGHAGGSRLAAGKPGEVHGLTDTSTLYTESPVSERYLSGYARDTAMIAALSFHKDSVPSYSDEYYRSQFAALETIIPIVYNDHVRKYIEFYTNERRFMLTQIIGRGYDYFPVLEEALTGNSMPVELINLAAIESALDTNALSKCGALGMWQFMPSTAKLYKLKVNSTVDERRNVERSTRAAMKMLNELHAKYDDWLLALAAYNAGPGRVNQALKNTVVPKGKKKDFWAIMHKLPKETQGYVPGFMAMCYLTRYYPEFNLKAIDPALFNTDVRTVSTGSEATINELASLLPITAEELLYFNPQFAKVKLVPANTAIKIPAAIPDDALMKSPVFALAGLQAH